VRTLDVIKVVDRLLIVDLSYLKLHGIIKIGVDARRLFMML